MSALLKKHCIPCRDGAVPIDLESAQKLLLQIPKWQLESGKLVRNFQFKNFKETMIFVNAVAKVAEEESHHPDILIHSWNKVQLTLFTHKIQGLHENDFVLAAKIDQLGS